MCSALVRLFKRHYDADEALAQAVAVLQKAKNSNARLALVQGTGKLCMSHAQYFAIPQCILSEPDAGSMPDVPDDAVPVEPPTKDTKHFMGPAEQIAKIMRQRLDVDTENDLKTNQPLVAMPQRVKVRADQVSSYSTMFSTHNETLPSPSLCASFQNIIIRESLVQNVQHFF